MLSFNHLSHTYHAKYQTESEEIRTKLEQKLFDWLYSYNDGKLKAMMNLAQLQQKVMGLISRTAEYGLQYTLSFPISTSFNKPSGATFLFLIYYISCSELTAAEI